MEYLSGTKRELVGNCCNYNRYYFINRIMRAYDLNELHHSTVEIQILPGTTGVMTIVDDSNPILLLHGYFDEIRIGSTRLNLISRTHLNSYLLTVNLDPIIAYEYD